MSANPVDDASSGLGEGLRQAIITTCRLSDEAVARVEKAAQARHLTFADAAVEIGIVTPREVAQAAEWARTNEPCDAAGIIETALARRAGARSLIVRPVEKLTPSIRLILAHDADHPRSERLRALRTELLLLNDPGPRAPGCVMALLSPGPGEGRSQLAAELAIAFSQLGRPTLLVDADLRAPTQHVLFCATTEQGLGPSLATGDSPPIYGVETLPFLSVLLSGAAVRQPLELLSGGRIERLVSQWRGAYEFVVIDTPPMSRFSDALLLATVAGCVIVVSRAGSTPQRDMKDMLRRLAPTRSRTLGAVINAF